MPSQAPTGASPNWGALKEGRAFILVLHLDFGWPALKARSSAG